MKRPLKMTSMELIKKLRDTTGSGIVDCKKALSENNNDLEASIKWLREKGILKAQKKQDRETKEGVICFYFSPTSSEFTVCKITCETDFVAKNEDFLFFTNTITNSIHENSPSNTVSKGSFEDIKSIQNNGKSIEQTLTDTISKIGENIQIDSFTSYKTNDFIFLTYLHNKYSDNASKIGSVIGLELNGDLSEEEKSNLKILPMQLSAMKPIAISEEYLDPKILEDEADIIKKQMGDVKNDKIEQIVKGKLNKFIKENTLLSQTLISDPKKSVQQLIEEIGSKNSVSIKVMLMDLYSI
ncbi:translation elongation factor Ts [Alphaproteobacteria bacterium]|nr:translation elongation factor Ts [Alphaproteobacteria bacterium]